VKALLIPANPVERVVDVDTFDQPGAYTSPARLIGAETTARVPSTIPGVTLLIDGDGLLRGAGANHRVSNTLYGQALVGDILAISTGDDGTWTDLTPEHRAQVMRAIDLALGREEMRSAVEMFDALNGVMAVFIYSSAEGLYARATGTQELDLAEALALVTILHQTAEELGRGYATQMLTSDALPPDLAARIRWLLDKGL
jgi:hypothetical protein